MALKDGDTSVTVRMVSEAVSQTVFASDISPIPNVGIRASTAKGKRRLSLPATVLTASPYKKQLRESKASQQKKKEIPTGPAKRKTNKPRSKSADQSKKQKQESKGSTQPEAKKRKICSKSEDTESYKCYVCGENFEDEVWIQCDGCSIWGHEACVDLSHAEHFFCESCLTSQHNKQKRKA